jgi:chromosome partitioning protein
MRIIAFVSQKGGVGKTTLAGHLAVEAEKRGAGPVALLDTDPQGSLASWWNVRKAETPIFVRGELANLRSQLAQLEAAGVGLVIIDTPPAITENITTVVQQADLVVIPTRPSPHDLRAVGATVDLVDGTGKPMVFVVNGATTRAKITGDAAIALSQHGTVAPVTVHHRIDFAVSMIDGRTVGELDSNSNSAREITELWNYVNTRIGKSVREAAVA